jgi:hypothetical protein
VNGGSAGGVAVADDVAACVDGDGLAVIAADGAQIDHSAGPRPGERRTRQIFDREAGRADHLAACVHVLGEAEVAAEVPRSSIPAGPIPRRRQGTRNRRSSLWPTTWHSRSGPRRRFRSHCALSIRLLRLASRHAIVHSGMAAEAGEVPAKPGYGQYPAWLQENHGVVVDDRLRNRYESVARAIHRQFIDSALWHECIDQLREIDAEYQTQTGYVLLDASSVPELKIKPYASFLLKTYRKNISQNPAWPDAPPRTGWVIPIAGFSEINDVVRTSFVVKYLDGVEFLVERFGTLAASHGIAFRADLEAKEEGYYAAHAYLRTVYEVPAERWDTEMVSADVEFQITTQVQELISRLLHQHYERRRQSPAKADGKWQWNYRSDEFSTNYLGHILHYVEGMIMDIREKQRSVGEPL